MNLEAEMLYAFARARVDVPAGPSGYTERWPHRLLGSGSTPAQARRLADQLVASLGADPYAWLAEGGFELHDTTIAAARGETEALCIPVDGDRFRLAVDSAHPADRENEPDAATLEARRRFRLCHEIAHTFFYSRAPGRRPCRAICVQSDWEECFCDAFARRLTGLREPPAKLRRAA